MHASDQETSIEALCADVKKGLLVLGGRSSADQQALNAESYGDVVYEITNGKVGGTVNGAVVLSRAPDFWKNLVAVGGAKTAQTVGLDRWRSSAIFAHTVSAPAALVKGVAVTTNARRMV